MTAAVWSKEEAAASSARYAARADARTIALRKKAEDVSAYATRSYPWGVFASVGDSTNRRASWRSLGFWRTKKAAVFAVRAMGHKVFSVGKVTF